MTLRFLFSIILIIISFLMGSATQSCASSGWLIYYEGGFRGKIIDAETKAPIEGVVVVAEYRIRTCGPLFVPECGGDTVDVKEVLTNKDGEFKIYGHLFFYLWPFTLGGEETYFTIFKPGYKAIPDMPLPADIYSIGTSTIEYLHEKSENYYVKKTKTYPEGLIYTRNKCKELIDLLKEAVPFNQIDYIYIPMDKALEKIKKLEIPLDCPKEGEPVPSVDHAFRNDVEKNMKNSFMIVELPPLKTREERLRAVPGHITDARDKTPLLNKLIDEEDKALGLK